MDNQESVAPRDDDSPAFPHLKVIYTHQHYPVHPHAPADVHYGAMIASCSPPTFEAVPGMSLRQHAAITLRVPDSGTAWLDDMIREARRLDAEQAALPVVMEVWQRNDPLAWEKEYRDRIADVARGFADALVARGGAA